MVTDMFIQCRNVRSFAAWQCPQQSVSAIFVWDHPFPWALHARVKVILEYMLGTDVHNMSVNRLWKISCAARHRNRAMAWRQQRADLQGLPKKALASVLLNCGPDIAPLPQNQTLRC